MMPYTKDEKTKIRKRAQQIAQLLGLDYNECLLQLQEQFIVDKTDEVFLLLAQEKKGE
ncbi:hypothetical protein [Lactovum odontotermitis]